MTDRFGTSARVRVALLAGLIGMTLGASSVRPEGSSAPARQRSRTRSPRARATATSWAYLAPPRVRHHRRSQDVQSRAGQRGFLDRHHERAAVRRADHVRQRAAEGRAGHRLVVGRERGRSRVHVPPAPGPSVVRRRAARRRRRDLHLAGRPRSQDPQRRLRHPADRRQALEVREGRLGHRQGGPARAVRPGGRRHRLDVPGAAAQARGGLQGREVRGDVGRQHAAVRDRSGPGRSWSSRSSRGHTSRSCGTRTTGRSTRPARACPTSTSTCS